MKMKRNFATFLICLFSTLFLFGIETHAAEDKFGKMNALAICGITQGLQNSSDLGMDVFSILQDCKLPGYRNGTKLYTQYDADKNPTSKAAIDDWFDLAFGNSTDKDLNVFYYGGHGAIIAEENGSYVVDPYNGLALGKGVSYSYFDLSEKLQSYKGNFIVILDCCGSGAFLNYGYLKDLNNTSEYDTDKMLRIASFATSPNNSGSLLLLGLVNTKYLIKGTGYSKYNDLPMDTNRDSVVTLNELEYYTVNILGSEARMVATSYYLTNLPLFQFAYTRMEQTSLELNIYETSKLNTRLERAGDRARQIYWESSNPDIATVSSNGQVNALKEGSAVISSYLMANGVEIPESRSECYVTVKEPPLLISKILMTCYLMPGKTYSLSTSLDNTGRTITWSSSNPTVAKVNSSGTVTPVAVGTTVIRAKYHDQEASCKVTVKKPSITLSPRSATIPIGDTKTLKASVIGPSQTVTWSSSNKSIATVSSKGVVKGIKKGSCTITAKANGVTAKCTIIVDALPNKAMLNAYAKKLREYGSAYKFGLIYVNNDSFPELVVTYNFGMHAAAGDVFTYINGKVKQLKGVGSDYSRLIFVPKKSVIIGNSWANGYGEITNYFKVTSTFSKSRLIHLEAGYDQKTRKNVYIVDSKKVSKTTYDSKIKAYSKKYPGKVVSPSNTFNINETNIQSMLKNYKSMLVKF